VCVKKVIMARAFICRFCRVSFTRNSSRLRHIERMHNFTHIIYDCTLCGAQFHKIQALKRHRRLHTPSTGFKLYRSAFNRKCVIYRKTYPHQQIDFNMVHKKDRKDVKTLLVHELNRKRLIKTCEYFFKITKFLSQPDKQYFHWNFTGI
jgi:hypothetical protein